MGFVFEHHQPVLFFSVDLCLYFNAAGVDFFGFIQIVKNSFFLEVFGSDASHVHEAHIFFPVSINLFSHIHIFFKGFADNRSVRAILKFHLCQLGIESRMAAVVRPVSVDDLQFCQSRIPLFFIFEILLNHADIPFTHGKFHVFAKALQSLFIQLCKSVHDFYIFRNHCFHIQGLRLFIFRDLRIHRVHTIVLDFLLLLRRYIPFQNNHPREPDRSFRFRVHQFDALSRRIRSLVVLSRQIFHRKKSCRTQVIRHLFVISRINRWFCKHRVFRSLVGRVINSVNVVAV